VARYELTPTARLGLRDILDDVDRQFGNRAAEDVLNRLEAAFALLAENPGIGHTREDLTAGENIRSGR
jgi:plasmid stabilization system protein ParE